jgi:hypothetical protein
MTFSSSHYLTVNVPYVHLLLEYGPQLDVSLPPEDDPKFLACCVLSENLPQFDFGVSSSSTGDEETNDFKWPHKYKSSGYKSGERGGQAIGPPLPIHRPGSFRFRYLRATRLKCAGTPSCRKYSLDE